MREIRFRAWDNETKSLFQVVAFSCWDDKTNDWTDTITKVQDCNGNWYKDFVLMQYTGLLDKNRKEIYEGDVLRWDGSVVGEVSFEHCEYIVGKGVDARALCNASDEIETIGNLYENPELLDSE